MTAEKYDPDYSKEKWDKLYGRDTVWEGAESIVKVLLYLTDAESVLDVGAGRGDFLHYFEKYATSKGIDLSQWMIDNKFCQSEILKENCIEMSFVDNSYDLVVGFDILEHLTRKDMVSTLHEMKRIAKKYIVLLPSAISIHEGETELDDPTIDLAGHLLFWHEDRWLSRISQGLAPKFEFDVLVTIRFMSILTRMNAYPSQWRHIEIYKVRDNL